MRPSGQHGAAMLTVLIFTTMIAVLTAAVMTMVQADLATGVRQQQAVQVFNIAEAGLHYAIARLQSTGAATYTGETRNITDGSNVLGTVTITVRCLDGVTSPSVNACAGANVAYRRVSSTARLPISGPVRILTAIVEGTTSPTAGYAICGYDGVSLDQGVAVYGDVGTNANLTLAKGGSAARICNSSPGGGGGGCTGPSPLPSQAYSGSAYAVGTITCGGGACNSSQIEGTIAPNQPTVCPALTLTPPSSPGTTPLNVPAASTVTIGDGADYGDVVLASTGGASCPAAASVATLVIDSGSDPNAIITVKMRTLWVGKCGRVVITGSGKVALWLLEPETSPPDLARQALKTEQLSIFGSTSTGATPVPITGDRITIAVLSSKPIGDSGNCLNTANATCPAVHFNQSGLISGTFLVPNGGLELDQAQLTNGAILSKRIQFDQSTTFTWDPNSKNAAGVYSNFNQLKYWKDQ